MFIVVQLKSNKSFSPLHLLDTLLLEDVAVVLDLGHRGLLLGLDHGPLTVSLGLLKSQSRLVIRIL